MVQCPAIFKVDLSLLVGFQLAMYPNPTWIQNVFENKMIFLYLFLFSYCFNILMLKINFKNKKIILIYFQTKNILKNNYFHNN
jgi:hypothetical protein